VVAKVVQTPADQLVILVVVVQDVQMPVWDVVMFVARIAQVAANLPVRMIVEKIARARHIKKEGGYKK
jgi:CheY-like chemotaxis protein